MINPVSYSLYTLKGLSDLAEQIQKIVQEAHPKHPLLDPFLQSLTNANTITLNAIGSSTASMLTTEIRNADNKRDSAFMSLRDHITAGMRRGHEAYSKAAKLLQAIFEKNNLRLYNFKYSEQSAALRSLFVDLDKEDSKQALQTMNATEWLAELKTAQEEFDNLYKQRITEGAEKETPRDADAKKGLITALQLILNTIGVLEASGQPKGIADTAKKINETISKAQAAAKR